MKQLLAQNLLKILALIYNQFLIPFIFHTHFLYLQTVACLNSLLAVFSF